MIYHEIQKLYDEYLEFLKDSGFPSEKRKGQIAFISNNMLPFYMKDKGFVVLGEGQTGTGKTIGYLFPLIVSKLVKNEKFKELKQIPQFFVSSKGINGNYFLDEQKDKNAIINDLLSMGEFDESLFKNVDFNEPQKIFITVYTKTLQDQIINEIEKKVNPYLRTKGVDTIAVSKIIGKTNYVCSENLPKIKKEIEEKKASLIDIRHSLYELTSGVSEENEEKKKLLLESIKDIELAEKYINEIIDSNITSVEELREKYKKDWENVVETVESQSKTSLFAPGFKVDKKGNLTSDCFFCGNHSCPRRNDLDMLRQSDVIVMNYHSFFHFMNMLSYYSKRREKELLKLKEEKEEWENKYGITVDINNPYTKEQLTSIMGTEQIKEFLTFQNKYKNAVLSERINIFGTELNANNMLFIFDEAHKFENVLIDFYSDEINIKHDVLKKIEVFVKAAEAISMKMRQGFQSHTSLQTSLVADKGIEIGNDYKVFHEFYYDLRSSLEKIEEVFQQKEKEINTEDIFKLENIAKVFFTQYNIKTRLIDKVYGQKSDEVWSEIENIIESNSEVYNLELLLQFNVIVKSLLEKLEKIKEFEKYVSTITDKSLLWLQSYPFKKAQKLYEYLLKLSDYTDIYIYNKVKDIEYKARTLQFSFDSSDEEKCLENIKHYYDSLSKYNKKNMYMFMFNNVVTQGWGIMKIPGQQFHKMVNKLFADQWSIARSIFTSATMPDFDYFKKVFHVKNSSEIVIESSFDYKNNSIIYVPHDIPLVMKEGVLNDMWLDYVKNNIERFLFALKGGVFILTTSNAMHNKFYEIIKENKEKWEEKYGLNLKIFNKFNKKIEVLKTFGLCDIDKEKHIGVFTKEYFMGIDLPGNRLTTVILPKLPFEEPDSPYKVVVEREIERKKFEQLMKRYKNPTEPDKIQQLLNTARYETFIEFTIKNTVNETKQAIGRLIRTESDLGAVIILDNRYNKYLKYFKDKVPHRHTEKESVFSDFIENFGDLKINNTFNTTDKIYRILTKSTDEKVLVDGKNNI